MSKPLPNKATAIVANAWDPNFPGQIAEPTQAEIETAIHEDASTPASHARAPIFYFL